jgi:hypothetical protein
MKQVLIAKNPLLKNLGGDRIELNARDVVGDPTKMNPNEMLICKSKLNFKLLSGDDIHIKFDISPEMLYLGLFLLGATVEKGELTCALKNLSENEIVFDDSEKILLIGTLLEKVSYRQIEDELKGGVVNLDKKEVPTSKGKRRTKKKD